MPAIRGENMVLSINSLIISCWRSCTLTVTTSTIGISTVGSGNWKEFEGVDLSFTLSGEGQIWTNESFTTEDVFDLQTGLDSVLFSFDVNGDVNYYGSAIITSLAQTGNVNDLGSFTIELQGTGELFKTP